MTETCRVHLVVNPFSARGRTAERWKTIREAVRQYYREFKYVFTERPLQATEIVRELLRDGFDLIIGVGGDGTLNEIANGFFAENQHCAINGDASLGMIPSGTGSDFIRGLKIPRDLRASLQRIKTALPRRIDAGRIEYLGADAPAPRYFVNVADFGIGAEVVRRLTNVPVRKPGRWTYYSGLLSTIRNYSSPCIRIETDEGVRLEGRFLIGAVANGSVFGGGMIIAPDARADDGCFDLVLVDDMKPLAIIRRSLSLYTGTIQKRPEVRVLRARSIEVHTNNETVGLEFDGEPGGTLPARFECLPACLNIRL
ncbi:MAG TPA: diacylglycerol kinase family lipid kinase [Candidatus Aminicenantes bacterium]|nr:diacylglycerol kinase family lipid kinase [Candidatus Aminicenantes bacterium]